MRGVAGRGLKSLQLTHTFSRIARILAACLFLGGLFAFSAGLGFGIHGCLFIVYELNSVLVLAATLASLLGLAGLLATLQRRGSLGDTTTRLLVRLLGQLQHLHQLHALVGLHRLLHVGHPCTTLATGRCLTFHFIHNARKKPPPLRSYKFH